MIHCNLSVLLAERQLKISKVAADTGISRTTLTALAYNTCQGIQMNTLNSLCMYLDVTPDQLLSFHPVDISVEQITGTTENLVASFSIRDRFQMKHCMLYGCVSYLANGDEIKNIVLNLGLGADTFDSAVAVFAAIRDLPKAFTNDIEAALFKRLMETILQEYAPVGKRIETGFRVIWPGHPEELDSEQTKTPPPSASR